MFVTVPGGNCATPASPWIGRLARWKRRSPCWAGTSTKTRPEASPHASSEARATALSASAKSRPDQKTDRATHSGLE